MCRVTVVMTTLQLAVLLQLGLLSVVSSDGPSSVAVPREFRVDYEGDQFLLDGQPFRYISGSMHYFRVRQESWRDRLQKLRAAGLNAVSTYVEWSQHEPSPGIYNFAGDLDVLNFIDIAQEEGLLVILRPGPYICAERDFGGLPPWLLTLNANMSLRSYDESYRGYVDRWLRVLMPMVQSRLYGNGGPVIMVQVENEYGSFDACDFDYTSWLRDRFVTLVDDAALLFTTDGGADSYLRCGKIQEVYATVDFGPGSDVDQAFRAMRNHEPRGPLVNSEFYPGWLTHWEEDWQQVDTADIIVALEEMLDRNASVNFYVFAGGTNYGFTSGANYGSHYQPSVTSYDYDAPLTEAGDPTSKYSAIREVIAKYLPLPDMPPPTVALKGQYASVPLSYVASVLDPLLLAALARPVVSSVEPLTFEQLGQRYGFVLYEATVPAFATDPALLQVPGIRDRAVVLVDKVAVGVLSRSRKLTEIPLLVHQGQTIQLLVENQGRNNYGSNAQLKDFKGIMGTVMLSGRPLEGWSMTGLPLDNVTWVETQPPNQNTAMSFPGFLRGEFQLPVGAPRDTFLNMTGFGKGLVYVNGINLGRYWPNAGPISTLYLSGSVLRANPATNHVVVFELESVPSDLLVSFAIEHIITSYKVKKFSKAVG